MSLLFGKNALFSIGVAYCLSVTAGMLPAISSSVEYLHLGENKAEPTPNPSQEGNRRQKAEGKKEDCKVEGNYNCLSELNISAAQPKQHEDYSSFSQWCENKERISPKARYTVEVLLEEVEAEDCLTAGVKLSKITQLELNNEKITDITPLSRLTNLTELRLNNNEITDITPLSQLTNLTELQLNDNEITDIISLSRLTNLTTLYLGDNEITEITPLSRLTNLASLYLGDNEITDITPLSRLTNLTYLFLENNEITDVTTLSQLTNLTALFLKNNKITDITPLSRLTNLKRLRLDGHKIRDITSLSRLTNLLVLELNDNEITDITPLSQLTNLAWLFLKNNEITDITSLSQLTNLAELRLSNNKITDITPLSQLTNLTELRLSNNEITDITPLSQLTNLRELWLSDNKITDITPLSQLNSLIWLELTDNPITNYNCPFQPQDICAFREKSLLEELRRRLRRNIVVSNTNTPEEIDQLLRSLPYSEIAAEQGEYFFKSETQLKAGALGSLRIPKDPMTLYDFSMQRILTEELDLEIEELGKVYGDAELYKVKKDKTELYISLVSFRAFKLDNTFVVIWEQDPRSID